MIDATDATDVIPVDAGGTRITWRQVSAGVQFTCAIRADDNRVYGWGRNTDGQLGSGGGADSPTRLP